MAGRGMEWVEIIEPRTKEHMYANLTTGECVWDPPPGVPVKRTDDNQWWELFDHNTSRFYYYNASNQKTVWHRPHNCDIIPLAKLQILKQNTEVRGEEMQAKNPVCKESIATQTPSHPLPPRSFSSTSCREEGNKKMVDSETQTSPASSPKPLQCSRTSHHHHHHHHRHQPQAPPSSWSSRSSKNQDVGRLSDSSSYSQSQTSLDSGGCRFLDPGPRGHIQTSHSSIDSVSRLKACEFGKRDAVTSSRSIESPSSSNHSSPSHHCNSRGPPLDEPPLEFLASSTPAFHRKHSEPGRGASFRLLDKDPRRRGSRDDRPPVKESSSVIRSFSFMSRRDGSLESNASSGHSGMHSVESTPQPRRRHKFLDFRNLTKQSSVESPTKQSSVDGLVTPMLNRRQKSLDLVNLPKGKENFSVYNVIRKREKSASGAKSHHLSDSSPSPQSPKNSNDICSLFDVTASSRGVDSGNSTLNHDASHGAPSRDTSPQSQEDSGLMSATTESRGSIDSVPASRSKQPECKSCAKESKLKSSSSFNFGKLGKDTKDRSQMENHTGGLDEEERQLYCNLDSRFQPLTQYLVEQAKLSGYRYGDPLSDDNDSLASEKSEGIHGGSDDEFADDEGMSQPDSSSQEYLDDSAYPEDERETYAHFQHSFNFSKLQPEYLRFHCGPSGVYDNTGPLIGGNSGILTSLTTAGDSACITPPFPRVLLPSPSSRSGASLRSDLPRAHSATSCNDPHIYSPVLEFSQTLEKPSHDHMDGRTKGLRSSAIQEATTSPTDAIVPDNLNVYKKGLFRKNVSPSELLSWSKEPISQPLLVTPERQLRKAKRVIFKLIQIYMGDRKAKHGMTLSSVAHEIVLQGYRVEALRDELFLHICKQTTDNPRRESLRRGWELMAICLAFFPPKKEFIPYLKWYVEKHRHPGLKMDNITKWPIHVQVSHYADVSQLRLERITANSARREYQEPTVKDVDRSRVQIFRPTMFGCSLEEVMSLQKERFPDRHLPWILTTLCTEILRLGGAKTLGIFREAPDHRELEGVHEELDLWRIPNWTNPLVPAAILKRWLHDLHPPLIPLAILKECIKNVDSPPQTSAATPTTTSDLPISPPPSSVVLLQKHITPLHRLVLGYLISFLQTLCQAENVQQNRMTSYNLAVVFAPNVTRSDTVDPLELQDEIIRTNAFFEALIKHMDTGFVKGLL